MKKIGFILILNLMALMALSGCGNKESANQLSEQTTAETSAQTDAAINDGENVSAEIDISDICDLTEAKLIGNEQEFICNDEKALETLENIFGTSKSIT